MKLLVVEDEVRINKLLSRGLRKKGYAVDCAFDGEEALELYGINEYDLMILDLNLPGLDGMEVLRTIRKEDVALKVIILSARSSVEDKVEGLDEGSNDYMSKPFEFAELDARIRNLLGRKFEQKAAQISCGPLYLDAAAKTAFCKEIQLNLTRKEYGILEYLIYHMNETVSAEKIIEHVWDSEADLFSNAFRVQLHSLRKKIKAVLGEDIILTVHGQGYRLSEGEEEDGCEK
ncbi:response regulator transcription factor [Anaerolentibacter hominis]|uniref:response regulator transcription factor n=1 Tax=Anaerolentibacter hominis TaxID=3079009 RepID=UPI0031B883DE